MKTISTPFQLPELSETYNLQIVDRCEDLIKADIWKDLSIADLHHWLANFETPAENYFAARLLDALIYRSQDQTVAMMRQMFQRVLPDLCRADPLPSMTFDDWHERLHGDNDQKDPRIRIVPVIRDNDPPTKSGPLIARLYKRHLSISSRWMIWPWQIDTALDKGIRVFLFVDDFLGTGDQFIRFMQRFPLSKWPKDIYPLYAPLVAHGVGIDAVKKKYPFVRIAAVETLDKDHGLFSSTSECFQDGTNSPESAFVFYEELLKKKGLDINEDMKEGHGRLQLAYIFQHATPNNCLPLFWIRSPSWRALFER